MKAPGRLHTLDYLRGLAALSIMIYHLSVWGSNKLDQHSFLGRLGVYGVSIFYVLSGLTLFHVYFDKMKPSFNDLKNFFLKRFFRIYPLLWLVIFLTLILDKIVPSWKGLFSNLSGLFGLIKWNGYYATGTWSIGNELVFYLFFPVFIFLSKKKPLLFYIFSLLLLGCFLYFAFYKLKINLSLSEQWYNYVNPLNQVFLFLGGYLIGYLFNKIQLSNKGSLLILLIAVSVLFFYPGEGNIAVGINRVIFSASCFLICFVLYKKNAYRLPKIVDKPLLMLGEASYALYLLHPIIWRALEKVFVHYPTFPVSLVLKIICTAGLSLVVSYCIYYYFERSFMKLGRSLSNGKKTTGILPGKNENIRSIKTYS